MADVTSTRNPVGLTFGFIAGLALVLFNVGLYLGGLSIYMSLFAKAGYLIVLGLAVWAAIRVKNQQGGYISLGEGFRVIFAVFALSSLLLTLFNYILFNYIDVPFRDAVSNAMANNYAEFMKVAKAPVETIEEARKDIMDPKGYSLSAMLMGFALTCMFFFPVSLIIALIMRKKKPLVENTDNSFNQ